MSYELMFKEQARQDTVEIVQWYEQQKLGLGDVFLVELSGLAEQLKFNPYTYQIRRKGLRLGILKRFPYAVAYKVESEGVTIYGIMHTHQHPKKIYQRARKK